MGELVMSNRQRKNAERVCHRKKPYASLADASKAADNLLQYKGELTETYLCVCESWHVGHHNARRY